MIKERLWPGKICYGKVWSNWLVSTGGSAPRQMLDPNRELHPSLLIPSWVWRRGSKGRSLTDHTTRTQTKQLSLPLSSRCWRINPKWRLDFPKSVDDTPRWVDPFGPTHGVFVTGWGPAHSATQSDPTQGPFHPGPDSQPPTKNDHGSFKPKKQQQWGLTVALL